MILLDPLRPFGAPLAPDLPEPVVAADGARPGQALVGGRDLEPVLGVVGGGLRRGRHRFPAGEEEGNGDDQARFEPAGLEHEAEHIRGGATLAA